MSPKARHAHVARNHGLGYHWGCVTHRPVLTHGQGFPPTTTKHVRKECVQKNAGWQWRGRGRGRGRCGQLAPEKWRAELTRAQRGTAPQPGQQEVPLAPHPKGQAHLGSHKAPSTCHKAPSTCHKAPSTCHIWCSTCRAPQGQYGQKKAGENIPTDATVGHNMARRVVYSMACAVARRAPTRGPLGGRVGVQRLADLAHGHDGRVDVGADGAGPHRLGGHSWAPTATPTPATNRCGQAQGSSSLGRLRVSGATHLRHIYTLSMQRKAEEEAS
jgi:hypothetical protein